jgi:putative membrane protein
MMIADHTDAARKGSELAARNNLQLAVSPLSDDFKKNSDKVMDELRSKQGTDFDKAYVNATIEQHKAVLADIDGKLMPNARDADLQSYLRAVRAKAATHLSHAQDLQNQIGK